MAFWNRRGKRDRATGEERDPDSYSCSFCGAHRREVKKLVAGPDVAICERCIALSEQILDDDFGRHEGASWFADSLIASVTRLGPGAPHARVGPDLRAAIELARGHASTLRRIARAAADVSDHEIAIAALRAMPAAERTPGDRLDEIAHHDPLGRYGDGLAACEALDRASLRGSDAILADLHRGLFELKRGRVAAARVAALRSTAQDHRPAIEALRDERFRAAVRVELNAVLALAALADQALAEAERLARLVATEGARDPLAHELLARVLEARGDGDGARAARTAGLAVAHPDSAISRRLASPPVGGPFR